VKKGPVIAIDGPGGVGKSTVSKRVAESLGFKYINTGAMYRAFALAAKASYVDFKDDLNLQEYCRDINIEYSTDTGRITIDGTDYTDKVKTDQAGELASKVSTQRSVRACLSAHQRILGEEGRVVMEGRDIGTVIFPDADVKIYLDAPHEVRAQRRQNELETETGGAEASKVSDILEERDKRDAGRQAAPLKLADDAVHIDTGELTVDEVVQKVLKIVNERLGVGDPGR
jgi:cytidylate kinase